MLEVTFAPDRASSEPIYRQLSGYLGELIVAGRLTPGVQLPPTRHLAQALQLNRNTVTRAYRDLLDQGLLTAGIGQGTFVADLHPPPHPGDEKPGGGVRRHRFDWSPHFSGRARSLRLPPGLAPPPADGIRYDFQGGRVAADALPTRELRQALLAATSSLEELANHRDPYGWWPLRRRVAEYLLHRGISCAAEQVAIVDGAQQALDLAGRVLLAPQAPVAMEEPGYFGARLAFAAAGARLLPVAVDEEGLRTDDLARCLEGGEVRLIYTTPAAQSPTGVVMSDARRQRLLELAAAHRVPIFEDDYDSELRYGGPPIPALKSQDRSGQILYAATFGKILFPGLRIGCVVAEPEILDKLVLSRFSVDMETNVVMQVALAELLAGGGLDRHVRRLRRVYAERLAAMVGALDAGMPQGTSWRVPGGGHGLWIRWPAGVDPQRLHQRALQSGIAYTRGEVFSLRGDLRQYAMLTYSSLPPADISNGVHRLARLVRCELDTAKERF